MIVPESSQIIDNNGFVEIKRNPISCVGVYDYLGDGLPYPAEPGKRNGEVHSVQGECHA